MSGVVALGLLIAAPTAHATPITIDSFDNPNPVTLSDAFFIALPVIGTPNPTLIQQAVAGVIGGERELLVQVVGTPKWLSAQGYAGEGIFQFGTSAGVPGSYGVLTYDGVASTGLGGVDLTGGGTNDRIDIVFAGLDAGDNPASTLKLTVAVTNGVTTEPVSYNVPEGTGTYSVPFADFLSGLFASVDKLSFTLNDTAAPVTNVDIGIDRIVAVPEPGTWVMLAAVGACLAFVWCRRKS